MIEAYNLYIGGYLPNVPAKSYVHKKAELKNIYSNIVKLNTQSPLSMIRLSNAKQAYALDVKEMSIELHTSTTEALTGADTGDSVDQTIKTFNRLLNRSDQFGVAEGKKSRPGGELRSIVAQYQSELTEAGIEVDSDSFLKLAENSEGGAPQVPVGFMKALQSKSEAMMIDPMEYVDKKVYSYAYLSGFQTVSAYADSAYSGMLFSSYC